MTRTGVPSSSAAGESIDIIFQQREDGSSVLRITRDDGTVTWQKQEGARARFFPFHDLSHFAVETELGTTSGFYGLIAAGWDISETDGKHSRGRLPAEALLVEEIVGLLDRERIGEAQPMTAHELNDHLEKAMESGRLVHTVELTDDQLDAIRVRREDLHRRWIRCAEDHEPMNLRFSLRS